VLSDAFLATARDESIALRAHAEALRLDGEALILLGEQKIEQALDLERRARDLDELSGDAPQLNLQYEDEALRGQRLREEAIRILGLQHGYRRPIHYKAWYRLVEASGHRAAGQNPEATFLTELSRSPLVRRVEAGTYELDPVGAGDEAARMLQQSIIDLRRAERELRETMPGTSSAGERVVEELRKRVAQSRQNVERAERRFARVARAQALLSRIVPSPIPELSVPEIEEVVHATFSSVTPLVD
jgi:hypothetical protein